MPEIARTELCRDQRLADPGRKPWTTPKVIATTMTRGTLGGSDNQSPTEVHTPGVFTVFGNVPS